MPTGHITSFLAWLLSWRRFIVYIDSARPWDLMQFARTLTILVDTKTQTIWCSYTLKKNCNYRRKKNSSDEKSAVSKDEDKLYTI